MKSILAVLLFGFVHSGSKLILQTGIGLFSFCLLYSGFRLMSQLPYILNKKLYKISSKEQLFFLAGMGLVGAALQVCEFKGIAAGVSVGVVTFLIYSYPIWTLILSTIINKEKINSEIVAKIILSLIGITLIVQSTTFSHFQFSINWIYPIMASFLMALWISLSNLAKKRKINSWSISFYYDLFSFISILFILLLSPTNVHTNELLNWLNHSPNIFYIAIYSILFGVVPNILFYDASKYISAQQASLFLLFEPVISSVISLIIWQETLGAHFWLGAILILVSNLPFVLFIKTFLKKAGLHENSH